MERFELVSEYEPRGDQPRAIEELSGGVRQGQQHQTLLGVTGSGKTFTMANVINELQMPALIISHNKTLAAQLGFPLAIKFHNVLPAWNRAPGQWMRSKRALELMRQKCRRGLP